MIIIIVIPTTVVGPTYLEMSGNMSLQCMHHEPACKFQLAIQLYMWACGMNDDTIITSYISIIFNLLINFILNLNHVRIR